ncbi:MAG: Zn-ribbon domain-containing OB-fold protein [Syntrophaceae bacterium]|nr:Zn-ribbon domain-containing OB-fold protein [Syntrophaceae bacterium]
MSEYKKPLPEIQPWSEAFWKGTKQHKLLIQECKHCGAKIFYPRKYCPECWSSELFWSEASGKGKIFSYSTTMAGVEEKFTEDLPFVLALVDLEEGVRMMGNVVNCRPEEVSIGMDVEVFFDDVTEEITLPKWKPAGK